MRKPGSFAHLAFLVTLGVKGFDGAVETLIGLLIWIAGPQRLYLFILRLTAPELADTAHSRVVHLIRHGASGLANAHVGFIVTYLLAHGVLKLGLAVTLLRGGGRWIYPVASLILAGFVAYMSWRLGQRWSYWLLGFALFDLLTLALVINEWRLPPKAR